MEGVTEKKPNFIPIISNATALWDKVIKGELTEEAYHSQKNIQFGKPEYVEGLPSYLKEQP